MKKFWIVILIFLLGACFYSCDRNVKSGAKVSIYDRTKLELEYKAWRSAVEDYQATGDYGKYSDVLSNWKWHYGYSEYNPKTVNLETVTIEDFVDETNVWATVSSIQHTIVFNDDEHTVYHYQKTDTGYTLKEDYDEVSAESINTLISRGISKDKEIVKQARANKRRLLLMSSPIWGMFLLFAFLTYYNPELFFKGSYGLWVKNAEPTDFFLASTRFSAFFFLGVPMLFFLWLSFVYLG